MSIVYYLPVSSGNNMLGQLRFNHQKPQRSVQKSMMGPLMILGTSCILGHSGQKSTYCVLILFRQTQIAQGNSAHVFFSSSDLWQILLLHSSTVFLGKPSHESTHLLDQPASPHIWSRVNFSSPHSIQLFLVTLFWASINSPLLQPHSSLYGLSQTLTQNSCVSVIRLNVSL